ncbi:uncharacterized protein A1O5_09402 [Cladophialophora psammophila CBS 110553]|uniref:Carboxymuconolactone decarboxylase-like domain-containing protein n=1 Tax=Cladophialophora psammophila CBS 110553 TaxID=1182543 RepID=W9XAE1_9EURO|nr:uncharacterized protein A1O5_09402 [Cladophialophora psammophila CBS 110553]EXJ67389.1 hypothetical protein A1O5_09402 [Cladophialophora psammophila CBS 110553]
MGPPECYEALFERAALATPSTLPRDAWYIVVAATLITADGGHHLGDLYQFILKRLGGDDAPTAARDRVYHRLHTVVLKTWTLAGMPRASDGLFSLLRVDRPPKTMGQSLPGLMSQPEAVMARTDVWWNFVFGQETSAAIRQSYADVPDFCECSPLMTCFDPWLQRSSQSPAWTVDFVVYGLYLAELTALDRVENELLILATVMGQGAHRTTLVHLRAAGRIGISTRDVEGVQNVVEMVAKHLGKDTTSWPRVQQVEAEE